MLAKRLIILCLIFQTWALFAQQIAPPPGKGDCMLDFFGRQPDYEPFAKYLEMLSDYDDELIYRSGFDIVVASKGLYVETNNKGQIRNIIIGNGYKTKGYLLDNFPDSLPFGLDLSNNLLAVTQKLGRPVTTDENKKGVRYYYYFDGIQCEIRFAFSATDKNQSVFKYLKMTLHPEEKSYYGKRTQGCKGVEKMDTASKIIPQTIITQVPTGSPTHSYLNHIYITNILNAKERYELYGGDKVKYQLRNTSEMKAGKLKSITDHGIQIDNEAYAPLEFQKIMPSMPNRNLMIYGGLAAMVGGAYLIANSFSSNNSSALEANLKFAVGIITVPSGFFIFKKGKRAGNISNIDFDKNWRMEVRTVR